MTARLAGFRPTGRRVRAPGLDLVELRGATTDDAAPADHHAAVLAPELWAAPRVTGIDLHFLEQPGIPGIAPLVARGPGLLVYATGPVRWLRPLLGRPGGLRAPLELILAAGGALAEAAARGRAHGGLGPDLVGLTEEGVVLAGWGLPATADTPEAAWYAPPERFDGKPEDASADLYALVACAVGWIVGRPLAKTAADARSGAAGRAVERMLLPLDLKRVLSRALQADPAARYPDPAELLADVGGLLEHAEGPGLDESARRARPATLDPLPDGWWTAQLAASGARELVAEAVRLVGRGESGPVLDRLDRAANAAERAQERAAEAWRALADPAVDAVALADEATDLAELAETLLEEAITLGDHALEMALDAAIRDLEAAADTAIGAVERIGGADAAELDAAVRAAEEAIEARDLSSMEAARDALDALAREAEREAERPLDRARRAAGAARESRAAAEAEAGDTVGAATVAAVVEAVIKEADRALRAAEEAALVDHPRRIALASVAEMAAEAARAARTRVGPAVATERERAASELADEMRSSAADREAKRERATTVSRAADQAADRVERIGEQAGRRIEAVLADLGGEHGGLDATLAGMETQRKALGTIVHRARILATEIAFCDDPANAEPRATRLAALQADAQAAFLGIEASLDALRAAVGAERSRRAAASIAEHRDPLRPLAAEHATRVAEIEALAAELADAGAPDGERERAVGVARRALRDQAEAWSDLDAVTDAAAARTAANVYRAVAELATAAVEEARGRARSLVDRVVAERGRREAADLARSRARISAAFERIEAARGAVDQRLAELSRLAEAVGGDEPDEDTGLLPPPMALADALAAGPDDAPQLAARLEKLAVERESAAVRRLADLDHRARHLQGMRDTRALERVAVGFAAEALDAAVDDLAVAIRDARLGPADPAQRDADASLSELRDLRAELDRPHARPDLAGAAGRGRERAIAMVARLGAAAIERVTARESADRRLAAASERLLALQDRSAPLPRRWSGIPDVAAAERLRQELIRVAQEARAEIDLQRATLGQAPDPGALADKLTDRVEEVATRFDAAREKFAAAGITIRAADRQLVSARIDSDQLVAALGSRTDPAAAAARAALNEMLASTSLSELVVLARKCRVAAELFDATPPEPPVVSADDETPRPAAGRRRRGAH